jgi:amino acid permease
MANLLHVDFSDLLFPYGVILFAFGSSGSVVETHRILKDSEVNFKKAIIIAGVICLLVYVAFALAVLGVTGTATSEIATIGLASSVSRVFFIFGNLFAALAMGTSFLVGGLSLKHSLSWDYKVPRLLSAVLVCVIPMVIFLLGLRGFITAIDIVGGVFMSLEMLVIILIYWRAKRTGDIEPSKYHLDHIYLLAAVLVLVFAVGAVNSVVKLF